MSREMTRREFFRLSAKLTAVMGLGSSAVPGIAQALVNLSSGSVPVLWLQGQSCSGCSVSLLDGEAPGPAELLTSYISLLFHPILSAATGEEAMDVLAGAITQGDFLLVVEGSIPVAMPEACVVGGEPLARQVVRAAKRARSIVAYGSCASFGGIPAAEGNLTGASSLPDFLKHNGIRQRVVSIPGCPAHPDWLVGTLAHLVSFGLPSLDELGRPKMFSPKSSMINARIFEIMNGSILSEILAIRAVCSIGMFGARYLCRLYVAQLEWPCEQLSCCWGPLCWLRI